jgi:hypothetical protein
MPLDIFGDVSVLSICNQMFCAAADFAACLCMLMLDCMCVSVAVVLLDSFCANGAQQCHGRFGRVCDRVPAACSTPTV